LNERERPTPNSARATRTYPVAPRRLLPAARRAVEGLPRWSLEASGGSEARGAVRTRRLFRFRDDVTARVHPATRTGPGWNSRAPPAWEGRPRPEPPKPGGATAGHRPRDGRSPL